jgi:hypothetical protein
MTAVRDLMVRDAARFGIDIPGPAPATPALYPPEPHGDTHSPTGSDPIPGLGGSGASAATAVAFDSSGLIVVTGVGVDDVDAALRAVDAAFVADRARLDAIEFRARAVALKTIDGIAGAAINNSSALVDDPELQLPVVANAVYRMAARIRYDATTSSDVKIGWSGPTGATMTWSTDAYPSSVAAAGASSAIVRNTFALTNGVALGATNAGTTLVAFPSGVLRTGTNAGTLKFRWAQNLAEVSDAWVRIDSWLELQRLS